MSKSFACWQFQDLWLNEREGALCLAGSTWTLRSEGRQAPGFVLGSSAPWRRSLVVATLILAHAASKHSWLALCWLSIIFSWPLRGLPHCSGQIALFKGFWNATLGFGVMPSRVGGERTDWSLSLHEPEVPEDSRSKIQDLEVASGCYAARDDSCEGDEDHMGHAPHA